MITLHHLENSRSQRILWLLEELNVAYDIQRYERDEKTGLAPDALIAVHALGKSPVITDGEYTIAESGAIIEYLVDRHGDGALIPPENTAERLAYTYWLHYAEGTFMPLMVLSLILNRIEGAPVPFFIKPVTRGIAAKVRSSYLTANIDRNLAFMESSLAKTGWFAGDELTAADIQMSFAIEAAEAEVVDGDYPRLLGFLRQVRSRTAYRAALEKGGSYRLTGT